MPHVYLTESHGDTDACECGRPKLVTNRRCKPCRQNKSRQTNAEEIRRKNKEYRQTHGEEIRRKDRIRQKVTADPIPRVMPITERMREEAEDMLRTMNGPLPPTINSGQPGPWVLINEQRSVADNGGVADPFAADSFFRRFAIAQRQVRELEELRPPTSPEDVEKRYWDEQRPTSPEELEKRCNTRKGKRPDVGQA